MKKAFTAIAVLALTIGAASALSFNWTTGSKITFNGTVLNTAALAAPATVELIYLGTDKAWSFDESGLVTDEVANTGAVAVTGGAANKGKASGTIEKTLGDSFADGSTFGNGNVFGVLITYTDTEGKVWYNLSSNTYTLSGADMNGSVIDKAFFNFAWTNDESGAEAPTAGGGWWTAPTVPEPVSAGLALAGIALLLKRRRA